MINRVILVGRITADPEIRYTQSGLPVTNFSLAVDRRFKSASGERETDFLRIVAWRKTAELIGQYVKKGYMLGIEGSLQMNQYQTKEGEKRTTYEVQADNVQFLDRGGRGGEGGGDYAPPPPSDSDAPPAPNPQGTGDAPAGETDLPF